VPVEAAFPDHTPGDKKSEMLIYPGADSTKPPKPIAFDRTGKSFVALDQIPKRKGVLDILQFWAVASFKDVDPVIQRQLKNS
jgi:hypothetical protein